MPTAARKYMNPSPRKSRKPDFRRKWIYGALDAMASAREVL